MKFTRGFSRSGNAERDPRLPPGQYDTGRGWPVLTAEVTPKLDTVVVDLRDRGSGGDTDDVDVGRDPRASSVVVRRRHPLRHHVVEARDAVVGRVDRHVARHRAPAAVGHARARVLAHRLHHEPAPRRRHRRQGVGGVGSRRRAVEARPRRPRAPARAAPLLLEEREVGRGSAACSTTTSPGSGSATATTTAATPGSSSGTRETEREESGSAPNG